jgi:hypothetical protein
VTKFNVFGELLAAFLKQLVKDLKRPRQIVLHISFLHISTGNLLIRGVPFTATAPSIIRGPFTSKIIF